MNIGIDIDDTISDTYAVLFPYAEKYTAEELKRNIEFSGKELKTHLYVETFHNWSEEEAKNFWRKYYQEIMEKVRPKVLAKEVIEKLKEEGKHIYLITARFPSEEFDIEELTRKWLGNYGIMYDELIMNAQNKVEIAIEKKIDIFIDDSYKNCSTVANSGIKTYMMDFIINNNLGEGNYKRVYSWPHLYQEIKRIEEES